MSKNDKAPDSVSHSSEFVIGHQPFVEKTVIHKGDDTYTGYGWDRAQADENAGKKYERGNKD